MVPHVVEELQRFNGFEALPGNKSGEVFQAVRVLKAEGVRAVEHRDRFVIAARALRVRKLAAAAEWEVKKGHVHKAAAL